MSLCIPRCRRPYVTKEGTQGRLPRRIGDMWYARRELLCGDALVRTSTTRRFNQPPGQGTCLQEHVSTWMRPCFFGHRLSDAWRLHHFFATCDGRT